MRIRRILDSVLRFLVTCCYVGYLPWIPGTYASVVTCALVYFVPSTFANLFFCAGVVLFSIVCVNLYRYEGTDPGYIVIDEFAGMCVTLAGHHITMRNVIIGFVLFRLLDIWKPFPIRWFEGLKGGYGVVADDVIAGIFASMILLVLGLFL